MLINLEWKWLMAYNNAFVIYLPSQILLQKCGTSALRTTRCWVRLHLHLTCTSISCSAVCNGVGVCFSGAGSEFPLRLSQTFGWDGRVEYFSIHQSSQGCSGSGGSDAALSGLAETRCHDKGEVRFSVSLSAGSRYWIPGRCYWDLQANAVQMLWWV